MTNFSKRSQITHIKCLLLCVRQILTKLVAANKTGSAESHITNDEGFCDIPVDGMKNGISFEEEAVAILSVEKWCENITLRLCRTE